MIPVFAGADPSADVRRAIAAGGGMLVGIEDATVVVWEDHTGAGLGAALAAGPAVEWIQLASAGVDWIFDEQIYSPRYRWTCAKGNVFADSVAEMALLLLLSGFRDMRRYVGASTWLPVGGRPLSGARICIVGAGGIATSLIRLLSPFECHLVVVRRSTKPTPGAAKVLAQSRLLEAVADADAVVLAAPLTAQTRRMIDRSVFAAMKPDALLVNVARGALVDLDHLAVALDSGQLGGAALDVTDPEPLPDGHPLWTHPRVIVTPHIATNDELLRPLFGRRVEENLRRWASGQALVGLVDARAGF